MKHRIKNFFLIENTTKAYQIYQVMRLISLVVISIVLVKTSFSTTETSAFELFLFIINIGSFFWVMGISNAMLSYYPKLSNIDKDSFFKTVFFFLQILGVLVSFLLYLSNGFGLTLNNSILDNYTILLLSLYLLFYSPTLIIEIKYILQNSYKDLLKYGMILYGFQFVIIFYAVIIYKDIHTLFYSLVIWIFFRWLWTLKIVFHKEKSVFLSLPLLKKFIIFSLPLIAHIFLGNGMEFIDGILVEKNFSENMFSIYRYGAREFPIILILIGALRSSMIPKAVENISKSTIEIKSQSTKIIKIFFPLAIVLMFTSKYIYSFVYNDDYLYSALLFNIYLLIISSRIILAEVFIYAKHLNKLLMYVSFVELISNIILSIILMQYFGIAGIAFATFVAFMGSKIYLLLYTKNKIGIPLNSYIDLKLYLVLTTLLYISFLIVLL